MELEEFIFVISSFESLFESGDGYLFLFFSAVGFGLLVYRKAEMAYFLHLAIAVALLFTLYWTPNPPLNASKLRLQKIQEKELSEHETELVEQYSSPKTVEEMRTLKLESIKNEVPIKSNTGRLADHGLLGVSILIVIIGYIPIVFFLTLARGLAGESRKKFG